MLGSKIMIEVGRVWLCKNNFIVRRKVEFGHIYSLFPQYSKYQTIQLLYKYGNITNSVIILSFNLDNSYKTFRVSAIDYSTTVLFIFAIDLL